MTGTQEQVYRHLRDLADELQAAVDASGRRMPRYEIREGRLLMMMSPAPVHGNIAVLVGAALVGLIPSGMTVGAEVNVAAPQVGLLKVADVVVAPVAAFRSDDAIEGPDTELTVEIVSRSNAGKDYEANPADYASMGVPRYLILDPRDGTWVLMWGIEDGGYANRLKGAFGDAVPLGDLGELDTKGLPRYGD